MRTRLLGKSGIRASEISLGCWAIGGPSWRNGEPVGWSGADDASSLAGLAKAFALGINHFDTADVYGDGHSEILVGRFLKSVPRNSVVIASKVGWFKGTAPHPFHPANVKNQLEQTLSNLGTDHVDIYYLHNAYFGDNDEYLAGAAEIVHRAKKEGKVRAVGQSAYEYGEFLRVAPVSRPDVLQFQYSALESQYDEPGSDLFSWAEKQELGMVLFGPLAQGLLLDKYDPDNPPKFGEGDIRAGNSGFARGELLRLRGRLASVKARYGASTRDLVGVALKYALARSPLAVVIPGFKNPAQVETNAAAGDGKPFSPEDAAFIRKALRG